MGYAGILKNTAWHRRYWQRRKIDWHAAYFSPEHPHRQMLIDALRQFSFRSVLEVGCGAGANIYLVKKNFPHSDVGGIDWNEDAIQAAREHLPRASVLQVGEATDIYISNKGADIIMSDMTYIYLDRKNFRQAIREAKRVARNGVVFCEFHSPSFWMRRALKLASGYHAYDYAKMLAKEKFHDIKLVKVPEEKWPGGEPQKTYAFIITARP